MGEIRYHLLLDEWVIYAAHRNKRPVLPKSGCPFCVGAEETPNPYKIMFLPNRFPSFKEKDFEEPQQINLLNSKPQPAQGICKVVLYSDNHNSSLAEQSISHISFLFKNLQKKIGEIYKKKFIKYVLFFENRGEAIGVSMHHPHGQIYAFPFTPPVIQKELLSSKKFFYKNKKCLHCEIIKEELNFKKRIVYQNNNFICFVPYYAKWPFEIHLYPKKHLASFLNLRDDSFTDLAKAIKIILQKYDNLYNFKFPYIMALHSQPLKLGEKFYHFHFEFYSPQRSEKQIKFLAGCEQSSGSFINDSFPEEKAEILRKTSPVK